MRPDLPKVHGAGVITYKNGWIDMHTCTWCPKCGNPVGVAMKRNSGEFYRIVTCECGVVHKNYRWGIEGKYVIRRMQKNPAQMQLFRGTSG